MLIAAIAGVAMYWLQEYAFYTPVVFEKGNEIKLTLIEAVWPSPFWPRISKASTRTHPRCVFVPVSTRR